MSAETITGVCWNVEHGVEAEAACDWVTQWSPDVVFWQELQPGQEDDVQKWLGMIGYVAEPRPGSTNGNALFVRDGGPFILAREHRHPAAPDRHAPANIEVRLPRPDGTLTERTLCLASVHLCHYSPAIRLAEADWLTTLTRPGRLALIAGDFNSYTAGAQVDWDKVTDRAFLANRTYPGMDGRRYIDDLPDRTLTTAGYVDAALWVAKHCGGAHRVLADTAGHRPDKAAQGGPRRIDRVYLSDTLAPALTGFRVGAPKELGGISDHMPLVFHLDRARLEEALSAPVAQSVS